MWTKVHCTEDGFVLRRFNESTECKAENGTVGLPTLQKMNGCEEKLWRGNHWYTEVLECSNPDYTIYTSDSKHVSGEISCMLTGLLLLLLRDV